MVEISSLTEHLLTECDKKDEFGKCYRCSEAVLQAELPGHIKAKDCNRECPASPQCGLGPSLPPLAPARPHTNLSLNHFSCQTREAGEPMPTVPRELQPWGRGKAPDPPPNHISLLPPSLLFPPHSFCGCTGSLGWRLLPLSLGITCHHGFS